MNDKEQAQKLVDEARAGLVTFETALRRIIETEAWTPLGYGSFIELYRAEFGDNVLAGEIKAVVVYAALDGGASHEEIREAFAGVASTTVESMAAKKKAGQRLDPTCGIDRANRGHRITW